MTNNTNQSQLPAIAIGIRDSSSSKPVSLSAYLTATQPGKWYTVNIPLADFSGLKYNKSQDITKVVFSQAAKDGAEHTIFIDDIWLTTPTNSPAIHPPTLTVATGFARHIDLQWKPVTDTSIRYLIIYRSADGGKSYKPVGIQYPFTSRYADFVNVTGKTFQYKLSAVGYNDQESQLSNTLFATTRFMTDEQLLTMVQEAAFRYYWDGAETNSGLAKEDIPGRHTMVATGASGFGIMALIAGTERKFITRQQAVQRFLQITDFLQNAEKFHGAFSHFISGPTGKVEPFFGPRDDGGDLVETSFLIQGLIAARAYFSENNTQEKQIRDRITAIVNGVEWDWYRRYPNNKFLFWHWSPDKAWIINHQLIGWNETMVTYLLAIASPTHAVPATMYYTGFANQDLTGQQYRINWGKTTDGSHYTNGQTYYGIPLPVGVSNGGPLFFVHYSYMGYDPHQLTDAYTNYFQNNKAIAQINHRYSIENPGHYKGYSDSCWGLTASDGPFGYSPSEPVLRLDNGKITPTGAVASMPYTPLASMKALRNFYYSYGSFLWGEYGFRDAFNLQQNWCSDIFMGLNQAPMTVMIENYRTGLLWKLFMSDSDVKKGLQKLAQAKPGL